MLEESTTKAAPEKRRHVVRLQSEVDVDGFRSNTRRLVAQGIEPDDVSWLIDTASEVDLFNEASPSEPSVDPQPATQISNAEALRLPSTIVGIFESAALHSDADRHHLLYRLIWRLVHEPQLRDDPLDADRLQAERMARAVRRDIHKMTAFVRFRPLATPSADDWRIAHVAWFEPIHHIVRAAAPFFARRFAQMRWAILTPECSVRWDGERLAFGPGASRDQAPPADAAEQLWLTYYESIFNPARLKLSMMQKEMPRRYWRNLPEATLIHSLAAGSAQRSGQMIEHGGTESMRRRPAASIALRIDRGVGRGIDRGIDLETDRGTEHQTESSEMEDDSPKTLASLARATEHCRRCPIGEFATQAVNGEGPPHARLMLVGEQPGDAEDLRGRPFVGPAGKVLDRAFAQLGWARDAVYVTNAVKHFKFELRGKRRIHKTPAQQEAAACLHWLEHEIALIKPAGIVALGATAARSLMGRAIAVTKERGQWLVREDGLKVLITLHPSALLRMEPGQFDDAFEAWVNDLSKAKPDLGGA
jgi:probable DNA metabolism protein